MKFTIAIDTHEDQVIPVFAFEVDGPLDDDPEFQKLCRELEYELDVLIDTEGDGISVKEDECLDLLSAARQVAEAIRNKFSPYSGIEEINP